MILNALDQRVEVIWVFDDDSPPFVFGFGVKKVDIGCAGVTPRVAATGDCSRNGVGGQDRANVVYSYKALIAACPMTVLYLVLLPFRGIGPFVESVGTGIKKPFPAWWYASPGVEMLS